MHALTWKTFAVTTTTGAIALALGLAYYLAALIYQNGGILFGCLTFGLVLDALMRRAIRVASWFWLIRRYSDSTGYVAESKMLKHHANDRY